ncbi:MAG: type II toxin-antitoxin system VapC family toxin [Anaerolineae bacterium]|nr:type II toxin-antitoxin system VapC family toxin [Anaerolineae bacterium]MBL6960641.1 type II toxin-antitoxin system VapC family toxin [Anaerolineales bacterium]
MNVVDSSGWLEYFADGENASFFAPIIEDAENLIVPAVVIYEVFKRIMNLRDEHTALVFIGDMQRGQIADLTTSIALQAAKLSTEFKIAMADSIILATARAHDATLWTQDIDFEGIAGVKYIGKK